ncbi:ferritin [Candidatus Thiosymbion oneisti]|uniref:ferritin n=1 Tax=Candidatus Thiosymbion oneisti TaxID=589554 RepID=UPI000A66BB9A|nr:ferritin [Candidatus Thiosymbion oneisti]
MISNAMAQRLNGQINKEFYSAYFYMSMSAHSESENLKGTAAWFMAKYDEEMAHAMKIYRYLHDQGARVELEAVDKPPTDYAGVLDMFEKTLVHEQAVTASFSDLVEAALAEKDHATGIFLQWFVTEQIEEEATVSNIIGRVKLVGERGEGLFMIDNELAGIAKQMSQTLATQPQ